MFWIELFMWFIFILQWRACQEHSICSNSSSSRLLLLFLLHQITIGFWSGCYCCSGCLLLFSFVLIVRDYPFLLAGVILVGCMRRCMVGISFVDATCYLFCFVLYFYSRLESAISALVWFCGHIFVNSLCCYLCRCQETPSIDEMRGLL